MAFADVLPIDEKLLKISVIWWWLFAKQETCVVQWQVLVWFLGVLKELWAMCWRQKRYYQKVRSLTDQFEEMNSSLLCGELLKIWRILQKICSSERTAEYYATRPCVKFYFGRKQKLTEDYLIEARHNQSINIVKINY